jgi:hypothetical protein
MPLRPTAASSVSLTVPQQELGQTVTSPKQIRIGILAGPQQISQRLPLRVWYRHER